MSISEHPRSIMDTNQEAHEDGVNPIGKDEDSKDIECYVCLETFSAPQGQIMCKENGHFACYECARKVIQRSLEYIREFPASCCRTTEWSIHTIWAIAPTLIAEKYEDRLEEYHCPYWLRVHCARPDCPRFRQTKYHNIKGARNDRVVVCLGCGTNTCIACREEWNENHLCERVAEEVRRPPWLPAYTPDCRIKRCPNCREWIEHDGGCNDMFCEHCGKYFCFVCLLGVPSECCCPPDGDPAEAYDEEGFERTPRAIHRDTGLNREGLNALEISSRLEDSPPPAESEVVDAEGPNFEDPELLQYMANADMSQAIIEERGGVGR